MGKQKTYGNPPHPPSVPMYRDGRRPSMNQLLSSSSIFFHRFWLCQPFARSLHASATRRFLTHTHNTSGHSLPSFQPRAILHLPGEADSGSAGVQPDEEYPGRWCREGSRLRSSYSPGPPPRHTRTPESCLKNPTSATPCRFPVNPLPLPPNLSRITIQSSRVWNHRRTLSWRLVAIVSGVQRLHTTFYACRAWLEAPHASFAKRR